MGLRPTKGDEGAVGRTLSSAADPLVEISWRRPAGEGVRRGPGVRPTASSTSASRFSDFPLRPGLSWEL